MCRLFYQESLVNNFSKKDIIIPKVLIAVSKDLGNEDGYFLANEKKEIIRTLNYEEYWKKSNEILGNSKWYVAHLRKSTNTINKDNIHGWIFEHNGKEYYTAHNGIFRHNVKDKKKFNNDSFQFFYNLFHIKGDTLVDKIKRYVKTQKGNGVAFIISLDGEEKYFFSVNDTFYIEEIITDDNKLLTVSSKKDILDEIRPNQETIISNINKDKVYNLVFEFLNEEIINLDFVKKVSKIKEVDDSLLYFIKDRFYYEKLKIDRHYYNDDEYDVRNKWYFK